MAESRDRTPTTQPPTQNGVSIELLRANLKGNEAFPQRYLGIYIELLSTIFESDKPVEKLADYLDFLPNAEQKHKLATAATALHEKYEIQDAQGNTIVVSPDNAGHLWKREQIRLVEALRSVVGFYKGDPGLWEMQPRDDRYEMLAYHICTTLTSDPSFIEDLRDVFQVLRATLRGMREEQEIYKSKFKHRREASATELDPADPGTMNYQQYGIYVARLIRARAENTLRQKYQDNPELLARRVRALACIDRGFGDAQT